MTEAIVNDSTDTLQLFLNGFAARDLAGPLRSFDDTSAVVVQGKSGTVR